MAEARGAVASVKDEDRGAPGQSPAAAAARLAVERAAAEPTVRYSVLLRLRCSPAAAAASAAELSSCMLLVLVLFARCICCSACCAASCCRASACRLVLLCDRVLIIPRCEMEAGIKGKACQRPSAITRRRQAGSPGQQMQGIHGYPHAERPCMPCAVAVPP